MPKNGSRFYFILTPFMVCFLLALSVLGLAANAVITYALSKPTSTSAATVNLDISASLHVVANAQAEVVSNNLKEAANELEKERKTAEDQKAANTQTVAQQNVVSARPQPQRGCNAARPFIYIASSGICMSIITVGLTSDGAVGVPPNLYQAGWFNGSAALGSGGASFVDGHSPGGFAAIKGVGYGTVITVGLASGQNINYRVTAIENVPLAQVNMVKVLTSPGLNLMTCSGTQVGNTYSHRFIVYSSRI
ncbi:MAG: class F sortase [Candidatus Nomurabacteria bacterium]|jgi:hypothetical protein|nr:class F sortase [Candidatus Nomurabacteria bacterium]